MHLRKNLIVAALVAAASFGAIGAAPAQARTNVYLGIGVGVPPAGGYYDPYVYRERRYRHWDRARWMRYRYPAWRRHHPHWRGYERGHHREHRERYQHRGHGDHHHR